MSKDVNLTVIQGTLDDSIPELSEKVNYVSIGSACDKLAKLFGQKMFDADRNGEQLPDIGADIDAAAKTFELVYDIPFEKVHHYLDRKTRLVYLTKVTETFDDEPV